MINNIKLENIKCFENADIDLSNLNILTGINGSGKSTVIQCILMIAQSLDISNLSLSGPLIEVGDYSDLLYELAPNDDASISIDIDEDFYSWGYRGREIKDKDAIFTLPSITGELKNLKQFDNYNYIAAERWGPRNNVALNTTSTNPFWLGKHGEYTIPVLGKLSSRASSTKDQEFIIDKLSQDDPRRYVGLDNELVLDNIIAWMGEISPNVDINATVVKEASAAYSSFRFGDSKSYKAINVGFGLSYALSIVTSLMIAPKGSLLIIENPEAHLHPRGQSRLGQLLGLASKAGVQIIIETHSEHVINGVRILVRQDILPPQNVNILYFKRDNEKKKSDYTNLTLNDMGQISEWPKGFFDQQAIDIKTLITGA